MFDKKCQSALFIFVCGASGGLVVLGVSTLLSGVKLELGSWADWFSGILTSLGLIGTWIASLLRSKVQLNIKMRTDNFYVAGSNEPIHINYYIEVFNSGHIPVRVREVGLLIKKINDKPVKEKIFIPFYTDSESKTIQPLDEIVKGTHNMLLEDSFSDNAEIGEEGGVVTVIPCLKDKSDKYYSGDERIKIDMKKLSLFSEATATLLESGKIKYEMLQPKDQ
ncbi:hypothetical protein [Leuconostoc sp. MTCC 10508]|uniref:hypothetical protein n=1 Tax=Leuconostoc sp. MTCC 10508 TaxID=2698683 RepID=UPI0020BE07C7|nr:hypothetical protein [Leuconostoc sp. MTCC 10508]